MINIIHHEPQRSYFRSQNSNVYLRHYNYTVNYLSSKLY